MLRGHTHRQNKSSGKAATWSPGHSSEGIEHPRKSFDIEMCREDDDYGGIDDDTDAGNSIAAREKAKRFVSTGHPRPMRNRTKEQTKGRSLAKTVQNKSTVADTETETKRKFVYLYQDPYAATEHQDEHYNEGETNLRLSHRRATVRTSHQDNALRESKNCRLCRKTERDFCGSKTRTNRQNKSSSQKHKPTDSDTATNRQNKSSGEAHYTTCTTRCCYDSD